MAFINMQFSKDENEVRKMKNMAGVYLFFPLKVPLRTKLEETKEDFMEGNWIAPKMAMRALKDFSLALLYGLQ